MIAGIFIMAIVVICALPHLFMKSPCCKEKMTSVFEMELDKLLWTCSKCGKEWI